MLFGHSELQQIVESVWSDMLGLPVSPVSGGEFPAEHLSGAVTICGEWQGIIVVDCVPDLASRAAGKLFGANIVPDSSQVHDALGEIANIIGGNAKALLPGPCRLGRPTVSQSGPMLRYPGCDVALQAVYHSHDLPFRVTVHQQREPGTRQDELVNPGPA